jgi:sulfur carrier protein
MTITVNGTERDAVDGSTLADLIDAVLGSIRGSAAVVDGDVVPRSEWASFQLHPGHHVELITAVQGG